MGRDLKAYAQKQLEFIYKNPDHKETQAKLCGHEPNFALINENIFGLEYLAARLAVACRAWEAACEENSITEESSRKAFLRAVMESFKSEKFLNVATAFSDYHLTVNAETGPVIPVIENFFKRLKVELAPGEGAGRKLTGAFEMMFYQSEGFRTDFENRFFEYLNSPQ